MSEELLTLKVVLLGETAVGKSCLISRFVSDIFLTNHVATMNGAFSTKTVFYDKFNKKIKYEIWDTAGQEKYRAVNKMFYQDASVVILVLDITRRDSFESIKHYWYSEIKENSPKDIVIGLAANKCDLYEYEEVNDEELSQYAKSINAVYKQTSALQSTGINDLFDMIGHKILTSGKYPEIMKNNSESHIKLEQLEGEASSDSRTNGNNKKKGCC